MNLKLRRPSCNSTDQFIQPDNIEPTPPDNTLITCTCGTTNTLGALKLHAASQKGEELAAELARRTFGDLLKQTTQNFQPAGN